VQSFTIRPEEGRVIAFLVSMIALFAGTGVVVWYAKRRPAGQLLTWGEAMVAAIYVFFLMVLAYGIWPHQWLAWADNELNWRVDKIFVGPGEVFGELPFTITYQVIRDLVAVIIYGVGLGGQIALWSLWQNRGKEKQKELPSSAYGRPLVKRA
jgi:hypothetical protein